MWQTSFFCHPSSPPPSEFYSVDNCEVRVMFQTSSLTHSPSNCLSYPKKPDSIPTLFNFPVQTQWLCTRAVRNLDAYSRDTHRVERKQHAGRRREQTWKSSAHLISTLLFLSSPSLGSQPATHQDARVLETRVEAFHLHPQMHPCGLRNHPHISKSSTSGNRLWDVGTAGSEAQKLFSISRSQLLS